MPGNAFRIGQLLRKGFDAVLLFRHHTQIAEDHFGEAAHVWRDQRGAAFSRQILSQSIGLSDQVRPALMAQNSAIQAAQPMSEQAEELCAQVNIAAEECAQFVTACRNSAHHAESLAATAASRANSCSNQAQEMTVQLQQLGHPPC
jgi:hypothetical protein